MQEVDGVYYPDTKYTAHVGRWNELRSFLPKAYPFVRQWGSVIDGGAFAGMWSHEYAKEFNRVYAFEPIEENIRCVQKNAPQVTVIPCALTDTPGYKTFRIKGANFAHLGEGDHSVFCTTIDSFEYHRLGLIKLDVEGQEVNALNGALQTLGRHHPVIMIEVKYDGDLVRGWLENHDYEFKEGNDLDEIWVSTQAGEGK